MEQTDSKIDPYRYTYLNAVRRKVQEQAATEYENFGNGPLRLTALAGRVCFRDETV
ncbi:MAG: hypothetical protein GX996_04945 [Firmicutes bacterium]|nr:hypothetical protein [Bacillota bacterium]